MSPILIYSVVLFVLAQIYALIGSWTLRLNSGSALNRQFFGVCLALAVWAVAIAVSTVSEDYESALLWRRVSSLGWGSAYALMVHYFLLLTGQWRLLSRRWLYPVLYAPAAAVLVVFGVAGGVARNQYHLIQTAYGWTNITGSSFWEVFFNVYYISYSAAVLVLLGIWGFFRDKSRKKQSLQIMTAYLAAFILGSLTDIFANAVVGTALLSAASFFVLIPVSVIYLNIKRYGLMSPKPASKNLIDSEILSEEERNKLFRYLAWALIAGSLLNIGHSIFFHEPLQSVLQFSLGLFITALVLLVLGSISWRTNVREIVMETTAAVAIPLIMFRFAYHFGSNIVWPLPLLLVSVGIISKNKRFLTLITVLAVSSQLVIWKLIPSVSIEITGVDYFIRVIFYIISSFLAYFVHSRYSKRLRENEKKINAQKMISNISNGFVTVTENSLDDGIQHMLANVGKFFAADRVYFVRFNDNSTTLSCSHEWSPEGRKDRTHELCSTNIDSYPWLVRHVRDGHTVSVNRRDLPLEAAADKSALETINVESLAFTPVMVMDEVRGFLGMDYILPRDYQTSEDSDLFRTSANLLAEAITKTDRERRIRQMAFFDDLTGLPNRALFRERLEQAMAVAERKNHFVGLMLLDLDSFKSINDTMGHDAGDQLLQGVAHTLSSNSRRYDSVCRFGGDEFLVVFAQIDQVSELEAASAKLLKLLRKPVRINGQEFYVTASAGVAVYPNDGKTVESLVKNADLAMYESKRLGRNRYILCSSFLKEKTEENVRLSNDLYRALEREELVLHYQAQVNTVTREVVGLEALLRWQHPEKGLISPGTFIPLAEQTGLINPIGWWVLRQSCFQGAAWHRQGFANLRIGVNVSLQQMHTPDLVNLVDRILKETSFPAESLDLEITESTAVHDARTTIPILRNLQERGITVSLDDFGTEYSSFGRLKDMPINRIKIDQGFIRGINADEYDEAIVDSIIYLARNLHLAVIAEGVETESQLAYLTKRHCDEIQGFYFCRPLPSDQIETVLRSSLTHGQIRSYRKS